MFRLSAVAPGLPVNSQVFRGNVERVEHAGEIEMPPFDEGEYLIAYLHELCPTVPVTFAEMAAWQAARGFELAPWEARLLRRLSIDTWPSRTARPSGIVHRRMSTRVRFREQWRGK